ncbi:MAG: ABC transporter substrate-binding protein [Treponema sp.]|nr:ABC transporter substrate-binding protein [Treponema sp.]
MSAKSLDFWVESPSPLKNPLKEAFFDFSSRLYEKEGILFSSYFPSVMGGDMEKEDYLVNMDLDQAPSNYFAMGFGESSSRDFHKKYIESGFYSHSEIVAWFCETMVVDRKRLADRPLPESYFDLTKPCYKGEVCIIGTAEIPDPLLPLFIQKKMGKDGERALINNLAGFGAPVNAIRHIGKSSNSFGSIFVMPLLFANVCSEIKAASVISPKEGYFAEPFILFSRDKNDKKSLLIQKFLHSREFQNLFAEKDFLFSSESNDKKIFPLCKDIFFPELEELYPLLKEAMKNK